MLRKNKAIMIFIVVYIALAGCFNVFAQSRNDDDRITPLMCAARDGDEAGECEGGQILHRDPPRGGRRATTGFE